MRNLFCFFLFFLGLCCFYLAFLGGYPGFLMLFYIACGCGLFYWGLNMLHVKNPDKKKEFSDGGSDSMRIHGDSYIGVYDNNGNFINVIDGGFTQGLDGLWRDNEGHVVEQDDDGEFHMY